MSLTSEVLRLVLDEAADQDAVEHRHGGGGHDRVEGRAGGRELWSHCSGGAGAIVEGKLVARGT